MGAAAEHRANAVAHQILYRDAHRDQQREMHARALQVSEDCNEFARQAQAYLAEPRGLRQATVERSKTKRGWAKRHAALVAAHNTWVDTDSRNLFAYHSACVARAKAAHALLVFALADWIIPEHILVPRILRDSGR